MSKGPEHEFPRARTTDLVSERIGDELVVYDGQTSEAHCLSPLAAAVFTAADGHTSPDRLAELASSELGEEFGAQHVEMALAELEDRGLVIPVESGGISRRGFMQRTAVVGGAAFGATLVTSVLTPAYGSAASLFSTSFSGVGIIVSYGGYYYGMKWDKGFANGSLPDACGLPGSQPGNCDWPPASYTSIQSGCLAGSTASVSGDSIVFSLPSGASIVYYSFKCGGDSGASCPSGTSVTETSPNTYTLPISCT